MPLHEDDPTAEGNLSDDEYTAKLAELEASAEPCPVSVPADEVTAALARLDDQEDHRGE